MAHGDAREGKWRGNCRMEWVASTLHTTSEHGVSIITTADAHTSAASSRMNWRPPADLNGLVRFAERRNLVSARAPSHFRRSLLSVWYETRVVNVFPVLKLTCVVHYVCSQWRRDSGAWGVSIYLTTQCCMTVITRIRLSNQQVIRNAIGWFNQKPHCECDIVYNLMFLWPCIMNWPYKTTNVMHWILFIRQILLLSSTCFEYQVLIFRRT